MRVVLLGLLLAVGASAVHCPDGWFTQSANQTTQIAECYKLFLNKASPIDTEFFCSSVVSDVSYATGHSASVANSNDTAMLQSLLSSMCELNVSSVASVGGVHMFGEYRWFDATPFALSMPEVGEGCLTLSCQGSWGVASCTDDKLPFYCHAVVSVPSPTTGPSTTTTTAPGQTTQAPLPVRPSRPAAVANRTCPTGWTKSAVTGACYRFVPKLVEGLRADAACIDAHPDAHLVSVYDEDDSAAVTNLLPTATSALIEGVFMEGGGIGVVWEDYAWFTSEELAAASPSTPTWPTSSNKFYQAWAVNEPKLDFGCISIDRAGQWAAVSCREPMPIVCSFMPSATPPSTTTAAPTTSTTSTAAPGATCFPYWTFAPSVSKCIRVLDVPARGRDMDSTCAASITQGAASASPIRTQDIAFQMASLLKNSNDSEALVGLSFIGYGEDGYVTDGSSEWSAVQGTVTGLWAPGEPSMEMGCIVVTPLGYLRAVACTSTVQAVVCQYDPATVTTTTATTLPTTIPTTTPAQGPLTVYSLEGRTHIDVVLETIGTYRVNASRSAVGATLWFSYGGGCKGVPPSPYIGTVLDSGVVIIRHMLVAKLGVVCVSTDGSSFERTNITFTVVDAEVDGIEYVGGDVTDPYVISRLSSTHFTLTGRNNSLVMGVRYSSHEDCNDPPLSFGPSFMQVNASGAYGYDVIDYSRYHPREYMDVPEYLTSFFVCVALDVGGVFTLVPSLQVQVAEEEVIVSAADAGAGPTSAIVLSQYDIHTLRLIGSGVKKGSIAGFAPEGGCITNMDIYTAVPVTVSDDGVPTLYLNSNHTETATTNPLVLCIADHPYLTPRPTRVRITVTPTIVSGLSTTSGSAGTSLTVLTEGYQGVLYIMGLEGLTSQTLSAMRVGFSPRSASIVATGICNGSFYGGRTFSPILLGSRVGIAIPRGFVREVVLTYHALCVSASHGHPSARVFHLTSALIDVRPVAVLRVGAAPLVSPADEYPVVDVCDQQTNLVLPVTGYGLQGGMSALLAPNPCVTTDVVGVEVPLRTDYTDPNRGSVTDGSMYLGLNSTIISSFRARYGSRNAWLCILDPVLGAKFTAFQFRMSPPAVMNVSATPIVYGEAVSLQVSGFGLDAGPTVSLGVSNTCEDASSFIIAPVALTKTLPSGIADFEFVSSPLSSFEGMFVSYTSLQTASLTIASNTTRAVFCLCVADVCNSTGIVAQRTVPAVNGFLVLSAVKKQVYIDSDEDTEPQSYQLTGPLVDAHPHTLVVNFVYKSSSCLNMTDADSPFATKATKGEVLVFPGSLPVGEYRVCFTTRTTSLYRYAALDFGLTAILTPATTTLFSINGSTRVTLHPGVERLLPIDGSGIRQSTVLRLAPTGSGCVSVLPDLPLHRVDNAWWVFFTEAHVEAGVGTQTICLKGKTTGLWQELHITVTVAPTREALWFSYFPSQSQVTFEVQFPAVFQAQKGRSMLYGVGTTDMVARIRCSNNSCPPTSRLIFVRVDSTNKDAPCDFGQNDDLPPESVAGPFTTFNGILVLPSPVSMSLSLSIGYQSNWTMCVEGAPSFWIQPATPVSLAFAPMTVWSVTVGLVESTTATIEAGSEAARLTLNGIGIEEGATVRLGSGCGQQLEDLSYIAANSRLVNTTFTLFGVAMVIDGQLLEQAETEPLPLCIARPNSTTYILTNISVKVVAAKDPSDPDVAVEPLLSVPVNATGTVYLSEYGLKTIPVGSAVMLSTACYFNSHGLPIMTVVADGAIHLLSPHTAIPTTTSLEICLRRVTSAGDYTTPFYQATGVQFGVINVTVSVAEVLTVARNVKESVVLSVQVAGDGGLIASQLLPFYGKLKMSIHAPCGDAHRFPALYSQRLTDQSISKTGGVMSSSPAGTVVVVVEGAAYTADSPASVCVSVDGGRQYFTTNVAYFEVAWNSSLVIEGGSRTAPMSSQSLQVLSFYDTRLSGSPYGAVAQASLWNDCVSESGVVLTSTSMVVPSLLPVGESDLSVTCGRHPPVSTGIVVSVSELSFLCAGLIAVGPSDVGRLVSEDICIPTAGSVSAARYAETCDGPSWAGLGSIVNGTVVVPLAVAFSDTSLRVCPKVYCDGNCPETGLEAKYVSSDMQAILVDVTTTIEINGLANGIVLLTHGGSRRMTVTTGGMDEANMLLSFLPKGSNDCGDARPEDVVDVADGIATVSQDLLTEVSTSMADARRVCYSNDGGANYLPVGTTGMWVVVAPLRVTGFKDVQGTFYQESVISPVGTATAVTSDALLPPRIMTAFDALSVVWSSSAESPQTVVAVPSTSGCSGAVSYSFSANITGALTVQTGAYPKAVPTAPFTICTLNGGQYFGPEWGMFLLGSTLSTSPKLSAATIRFDTSITSSRVDDTFLVLDTAMLPPGSEEVRDWAADALGISPAYVQAMVQKGPTYSANITITRLSVKVSPTPSLSPSAAYTTLRTLLTKNSSVSLTLRSTVRTSSGAIMLGSESDVVVFDTVVVTPAEKTVETNWGWSSVPILLLLPAFLLFITVRTYYMYFDISTMERIETERAEEEAAREIREREIRSKANARH